MGFGASLALMTLKGVREGRAAAREVKDGPFGCDGSRKRREIGN